MRFAAFILLEISLTIPLDVWGCENQFVRDVAFQEGRDVHRLSVIGSEDDAAARHIQKRLEKWLAPLQPSLNLELHYLSIDDPAVQWREYGIPSAPPTAPVVILSGFRSFERSAFYIQHWQPAPTDDDLLNLMNSPVREFIAREAVRNLAVLLYVPARFESNPSVEDILKRVVDSYASEPIPLTSLHVDRSDERERVLASFFGIKQDGPDFLAIVFGRGKAMPPLIGGDINEANIHSQLEELKGDCSCLLSTLSLGVDLPMMWTSDLDASVVTLASLTPGDERVESSVQSSNAVYTALWAALLLVPLILFAGAAVAWKRGLSL